MKYPKELFIAQKAAKEAAELIKTFTREDSFGITLKGKNDLVTDADVASEKKIISIIKSEFPDDQFLAEESSHYVSLPKGRIWIIDPIDGTTNFVHGFPVYCVSIAFWDNGLPKVGVVLQVSNGEMFHAVEGEGAYLNGKPIHVSDIQEPSSSLIGTGFPYKDLHLVDSYLALFKTLIDKTHGVRRPGAASYDLCCVAAGRFEGFYEYGLSPWDVAAGVLIIKEAGGEISDWRGGENWLFGQRIIAGNKPIRVFLEKEIKAHFEEKDLGSKS